VFTEPLAENARKISLYSGMCEEGADFNWLGLGHELKEHLGIDAALASQGNHAILTASIAPEPVKALDQGALSQAAHPFDRACDRPLQGHRHAGRGGLRAMPSAALAGSHLVGHTRMATESAVTPDRAHPSPPARISAWCTTVRCRIPTACAACWSRTASASRPTTTPKPPAVSSNGGCARATTWKTALQKGFEALDGFYTFLMGTADKLALIRDPFACKPAVVAETDDYVAIALRIPFAGASARHQACHGVRAGPEEMYVWNA